MKYHKIFYKENGENKIFVSRNLDVDVESLKKKNVKIKKIIIER